jgi:hypothetical protein
VGRVGDVADDGGADAIDDYVVDGVVLEGVGLVGGKVAAAAVLAGPDVGDLVVELGQPVLCL